MFSLATLTAQQNPGKFAVRVTSKVSGATAVGSAQCEACHESQVRFYQAMRHRKPFFEETVGWGCESCHGPGSKHLETAARDDIVITPSTK